MEGGKWSGAYNGALASVGKNELFKQMAVAGIFYHLYNQVCLMQVNTCVPLHCPVFLCFHVLLCELCLLPKHCNLALTMAVDAVLLYGAEPGCVPCDIQCR